MSDPDSPDAPAVERDPERTWLDTASGLATLGVVCALVLAASAAPYWAAATWQSGAETTFQTERGGNVTIGFEVNHTDTTPFPNKSAVRIPSATVVFNGSGDARIGSLTGSYAFANNLDVDQTPLIVDPVSKPRVRVEGGATSLSWRDPELEGGDNGEEDFRYTGTSGTTHIAIGDVPPNTSIRAVNLSDGKQLAKNVSTENGTIVFSSLPNSVHSVDLRNDSAPFVSDFEPANNSWKPSGPVTLNVTIKNQEGKTTVDIYAYDPDSIWTQFTNSPFVSQGGGTVKSGENFSVDVTPVPGRNPWYVRMTDSDDEVYSNVFYYRHPGGVLAYNSSSMDPVSSVTATIKSQDSSYSTTKSNSSGGFIDFEGAPDETLNVTLSSSGFYDRTLVVSDPAVRLYTTLYPDATNPASDTEPENYTQNFTLDDRSGEFPPDQTDLLHQRKVDGSWRTEGVDYCGAANLCQLEMQDGVTYRLQVRSPNGSYTFPTYFFANASNDDTEVLVIPSNDTDGDGTDNENDTSEATNPPTVKDPVPQDGTFSDDRDVELKFTIFDPDGNQYKYALYLRSDESNFRRIKNRTYDFRVRETSQVDAYPGENIWAVVAEDNTGARTEVKWRFDTPAYLRVQAPNGSILKTQTTANLTSLESTSEYDLSSPNGTIDLEGVIQEQLGAHVNASGYYGRDIVIDDPADNTTTYLRPLSAEAPVEQCFELDDRTGNFPYSSSSLEVQRSRNGSYLTVAGDDFGAGNRACVDLVPNVTYNLVVRSFSGNVRDVGRWEQPPPPTELQPIVIGEQDDGARDENGTYDINYGGNTSWSWDAWMGPHPNDEDRSRIYVRFADESEDAENTTTDVRVRIWEHRNQSNEIYDRNYSDVEDLSINRDLSANQSDLRWTVNLTGTQDGESFSAQRVVGRGPGDLGVGIIPHWLLQYGSAGILVLTAGSVGRRNIGLAAVTLPVMAAVFYAVGWLTGVASMASLLGAATLGIVRWLLDQSGGPA